MKRLLACICGLLMLAGLAVPVAAAIAKTTPLASADAAGAPVLSGANGGMERSTATETTVAGLRYRIDAAVNGMALDGIPGTQVELWHNAPAGLRVVDEQGGELPNVTCDEARGRVVFTVNTPGIYTLLEPDGAAAPLPVQAAADAITTSENSLPGWGAILAVGGVGVPAVGVAGGLLHRRAKARRGE
ncbi:hypothetical protein LJC60_05935 [Ruminococcaceae bacterium OttesenSCG-928-D13]|nr:hypothetical protein [Ruminococcaceae bacterium OttesenSCG-928-D13]